MKPLQLPAILATGLFAATSLQGDSLETREVIDLEAFIVEESTRGDQDPLNPSEQLSEGFFGRVLSLTETPRSMTVIPAPILEWVGIDDYDALTEVGAGTQRTNYFGLAGSAFLRGARAGTYYDGILRLYQRNEMPMSFGALERIELVRGSAPAGLSPTLVGGYVNQVPKSPFFDQTRGEIRAGIGKFATRSADFDYGGPFLLGDLPAAYRVSLSMERSDRFYKNTPEERESAYLGLKMKLNDRQRLFLAGEYYRFRSSEIPGINRPTQSLVDHLEYVIGEPASLVDPGWDDTANRSLLTFPFTLVAHPALYALGLPGDRARSSIDPALLDEMIWLGDQTGLERVYTSRPADEVPPSFQNLIPVVESLLAGIDPQPQDTYVYTPAYFEAGGKALTEPIARNEVLADPRDFADAKDVLLYGKLDTRIDEDRSWTLKTYFEHLQTDKASTYGFAMRTRQSVLHLQPEWQQQVSIWSTELHLGADFRYSEAKMLQDFDAEPFSRRDLSRVDISPNSVVLAGSQTGPQGNNLWSSFGGASRESKLKQAGFYLEGVSEPVSRLRLFWGMRLEGASWSARLPSEIDFLSVQALEASRTEGEETLTMFHLNPVFEFIEDQRFYAALQIGKGLSPTDGGTISGPDNFTDVELFEGGWKGSFIGGKFNLSLSVYHWDQATFSNRDAAARPLRAKGIELEGAWDVTDRWMLFGGATAQRVYLRKDTLGFGAFPADEEDWALNGGFLNAGRGRTAPGNPGMVFAGSPEVSTNLYSLFQPAEGWTWLLGVVWREAYWHNMERTIRIPSSIVWKTSLEWSSGPWTVRGRVDNLFDQDYWIGQEPIFASNTLIGHAPGRKWYLEIGYAF